ncbi:MAG: DUF1761 domain-containing protein [Thermoplasmatota archaeon]
MAAPMLSDLNWLAIVLAVVWNFVLGFAWYAKQTPTGKVWMKAMNVPADAKPTPGDMLKGLILMLVGSVLTMAVLAYLIVAMKQVYDQPLTWMGGLYAGFFVWLGFYLPLQLGGMAWERKSGALTAVNAGYHFVSLLVSGIIIAAMSA